GVVGHQRHGVIQVPCLNHAEPTQLLLGFSVRTVGNDHFSALRPQRFGSSAALQSLAYSRPMTASAQGVVVGKTLLDYGFSLALGHRVPQPLVRVTQAAEFHDWLLSAIETLCRALPSNNAGGHSIVVFAFPKSTFA